MLITDILVNAIKFDGMTIPISRGETTYFTISFHDQRGQQILLTSSDKLTFGVKRNPDDVNFILKKTVPTYTDFNGEYPFSLSTTETNITPGRYYFDVTIKRSGGVFIRPIQDKQLIVKPSVTKIGDVN